jgi:hypothetical protein
MRDCTFICLNKHIKLGRPCVRQLICSVVFDVRISGKKAAMEEQLKRIIAGQELEGEDSDKELLILGRGQRDKKRKVLSDDGEDDDEAKV